MESAIQSRRVQVKLSRSLNAARAEVRTDDGVVLVRDRVVYFYGKYSDAQMSKFIQDHAKRNTRELSRNVFGLAVRTNKKQRTKTTKLRDFTVHSNAKITNVSVVGMHLQPEAVCEALKEAGMM